jgi:hypothetical protein
MRLILSALLGGACFAQISHVTLSEPLAIPTAILKPGAYKFTVVDGLPDRKIVRVEGGDKPVALFVMAPNPRIRKTGETLAFWQGRGPGRALRAWFIPGESIAAEAVYPKEQALELTRRFGEPVPAIDPGPELKVAPDARLSREDLTVLQLWSLDYGPVEAENRQLAAAKLETVAWRPAIEKLPQTASWHGNVLIAGLVLLGAGLAARRMACGSR